MNGALIGLMLDLVVKVIVIIFLLWAYFSKQLRSKIKFIPEKYRWLYIIGVVFLFLDLILKLFFRIPYPN